MTFLYRDIYLVDVMPYNIRKFYLKVLKTKKLQISC